MRRRSLVLIALLGLSSGLLLAQAPRGAGKRATAGGTDVKSLLDQGLYSYDEGDFDAAHAAFEKAFAQNPTSDAIADFVERATEAKVFQMLLSKNEKLVGIARQILESSSRSRRAKLGDPEESKRVVDDTLGTEGQEQLLKMVQNANDFGRNLVPALIPALEDSDLGRRSAAINWIARHIGRDAIPVLQAARKHPSATVRRNVAVLLGSRLVRHVVNLATLKAMVETDPASEVKEAAAASLAAVLGDLNGSAREASAKEYFLENAILYYSTPHRNPFAGTQYVPTIYKLEGNRIAGEVVAEFQLSDRMAQQALEEALELDPTFHVAKVLTLSNDAAQVYEYDLNVAHYAKNEGQQADIKALLEKQRPYVDYVLRNRVLCWPSEVLYDALAQAIEDGRSEVAQKIVEAIRETHRSGQAPESLVKALEDTNSRLVRIAAAIALAHWNPTSRDFTAGDQVVSILGEAVLSSGVRTAQKIMGDAQQANRFGEMLEQLDMEHYTAISSIDRAYDAIVNSPPDVILMDDNVTKSTGRKEIPPINYFVTELRKNYRTANVPVVVIVPGSELDKAKKTYESEELKVWVVPDSIDRLGLQNTVFNKIFDDKDDAKAHATRLARSAAEAINYLATVPTRIPVKKSVDQLRKVLKNRPDEVRIPSIMALGNLKASEAAGELAAVFANAENAKSIRIEAMRALGKSIQAASGTSAPLILKTIQDGMQSTDLELRRAAWIAFSNSGADPRAQLKALMASAPEAAGAGSESPEPAPEQGPAEAKPAEEGAADAPAAEPESGADEKITEDPAPSPEEN